MKKLFFLILFILILTFSVSYAVDYQPEIEEKLQILENKGVVPTGFTNWIFNTSSYKTDLKNDLRNSRYKGYCLIKTGTTGDYANRFFIYLTESTTITNRSNSTDNAYYNYWNCYGYIYNITSNSYSNSSSGSVKMNNVIFDYVYTSLPINTRQLILGANEEYGGNYILSSFEFNPTTTSGYINITANGVTESFIRRPFSYSVNNTRLGYIINPNDFYAIEGYLSYFIDISGDSNVLETIAGFTKNQNGTYNNNLFITSQGEITVKTSKLLNMQGIALYFRYKEDANSSYEYSDEYYYYTYFYGTNPVSGDLISPDLNSTADVGLVNALSDFFNTDSGESNVPYLIGSLSTSGDISFSGDFFTSGDIFGFTYVNYDDWGFGDFVVWTINKIIDSFSSYEDVTVSAGFLGTISTADFVIPNSTFKAFLGTISSGLLVVLVLFWYWRLIVSIGTLDLKSLSSYDLDNNFGLF